MSEIIGAFLTVVIVGLTIRDIFSPVDLSELRQERWSKHWDEVSKF